MCIDTIIISVSYHSIIVLLHRQLFEPLSYHHIRIIEWNSTNGYVELTHLEGMKSFSYLYDRYVIYSFSYKISSVVSLILSTRGILTRMTFIYRPWDNK